MTEDNLINQTRLESARKQRASLVKSDAASSTPSVRFGASAYGKGAPSIGSQGKRRSSSDKSTGKVLTLAPNSYTGSSYTGKSSSGIPSPESGSKNVDSSNDYSSMLLAALIREVENLDVPNGPFYL